MHVVIATHGRPDLLRRTLDNLCQVQIPKDFESIYVVENGSDEGARDVCKAYVQRIPIQYYNQVEGGKSRALQWAVEKIKHGFVVLFDDDIRCSESILKAYAHAASIYGRKHVYGGPFDVDYEEEPPDWLREHLPVSAGGPMPGAYKDIAQEWGFLGCNYGIFVEDILEVGGFRLDIGPGAKVKGLGESPTGQETELQKRLFKHGCIAKYVEDAKVWHYVPKERCSQHWTIQRKYRDQLSKALLRKEYSTVNRRIFGLPLKYLVYMFQMYIRVFLAEKAVFLIPDKRMRFCVRHCLAGVRGRLAGMKTKEFTKV